MLAATGFFSRYLTGPLSYIRRHITISKCVECVVKHFLPSCLQLLLMWPFMPQKREGWAYKTLHEARYIFHDACASLKVAGVYFLFCFVCLFVCFFLGFFAFQYKR